ncbi:MAG TPA: polysaccharide deacetylase family protein, partial [Candidatus Saccharimonadales bacterium]|nr:polysaccharide deacetylase family protein [Candidatus Saccharimonadales bacterium]
FGQALISVTFDDGWGSVYTTAMPLLDRYGIHSTQYIISDVSKDQAYMSDAQLKEVKHVGHELEAHTVSHPDITTLSDKDLTYQLQHSQHDLSKRFGGNFDDFASPYGHTDARTLAAIKQYYRSHRNVNGDYTNGISHYDINVAGSFDRYNIIGVTVRKETTVQDLANLVNYAVAHNGWLVLNYHAIDEQSSDYALDITSLESQLKYLSSTNVRIVTMGQVLDTIAPIKTKGN